MKKTNCPQFIHLVDAISGALCTGHTYPNFPSCGPGNTSLFYKAHTFGHITVPIDRLFFSRVFKKPLIKLNLVLCHFPPGIPKHGLLRLLLSQFSPICGKVSRARPDDQPHLPPAVCNESGMYRHTSAWTVVKGSKSGAVKGWFWRGSVALWLLPSLSRVVPPPNDRGHSLPLLTSAGALPSEARQLNHS